MKVKTQKIEEEKKEEENALSQSEELIKSKEFEKAESVLLKINHHYIDQKLIYQEKIRLLKK